VVGRSEKKADIVI